MQQQIDVSEQLKKELVPDLTPGKVITFKLLNGVWDEKKKQEVFGGSRSIVLKDRIRDPFDKQHPIKNIVVARGYDEKDRPIPEKHWVISSSEGEANNGFFHLSTNNIQDVEKIEHLCLSNKREDNKHRDQSVVPQYNLVDSVGDSKRKNRQFAALTHALQLAEMMGREEIRAYAASQNWNLQLDLEELHARIYEEAKAHPDTFVSRVNDKDSQVKTVIKQALDRQIITYDVAQHRICHGHNSSTLAKLERVEGVDSAVELFFLWTEQAKNGAAVIKDLRNKVADKLRTEAGTGKDKKETDPKDEE